MQTTIESTQTENSRSGIGRRHCSSAAAGRMELRNCPPLNGAAIVRWIFYVGHQAEFQCRGAQEYMQLGLIVNYNMVVVGQ